MPSLYGQTVANNYGRMVPQQTYGTGQIFSQFGTRQYRFLKVTAVNNSTAVLFQKDTGLTGGAVLSTVGTGYQASNSAYSVALRAIQTVAEVNFAFVPGTSGFVVAITEDTLNEADSGNTGTGYGIMEAAIVAALKSISLTTSPAATVSTIDIDSTGIAIA